MRSAFAVILVASLAGAGPAAAATPITLLYTAGDSFTETYVAKDQGFFSKHGLDVTLQAAQNGSVISAALTAGSAQIGAPTPTVLLQGDEQGLDLVIVASANRNPIQPPVSETGIAARSGSGIKSASDLVGKKVAVPGLGGTIDVLMKKWVQVHGADNRRVHWVEFMLPRMPDSLSAGLADAVAVVNPFLGRIVRSKVGYIIGDFGDIEPPGAMVVVYAATRRWAQAHTSEVAGFRAALEESKSYIETEANEASVRASIAKYTKLPPEAAQFIEIPTNLDPEPRPAGLAFWIEACRAQGLIKGNPDPVSLIAP
jgi:NitT/TauT family transport system substrate-binding protein